jgi:hypothetical protein
VRYHSPLEQKPESLQGASVFLAFGLTDRKRNGFADRWIDDRIVGIHDVHVRQNMTLIDEKSGCCIVARRRVVARRRSIDAVGPHGAYGIQERIIFVVGIIA